RARNVTGVQTCALPISGGGFADGVLRGGDGPVRPPAPGGCSPRSVAAGPGGLSLAVVCCGAGHRAELHAFGFAGGPVGHTVVGRSEERRVGEECGCRWL